MRKSKFHLFNLQVSFLTPIIPPEGSHNTSTLLLEGSSGGCIVLNSKVTYCHLFIFWAPDGW